MARDIDVRAFYESIALAVEGKSARLHAA